MRTLSWRSHCRIRWLLLLDEPTTGLDPAAEADLAIGLVAAVGKTVLLVTHQLRSVGLADQVVRLDNGRVTIAGSNARSGRSTGGDATSPVVAAR